MLQASEEAENEYRHDLAPIREGARKLLAQAADLDPGEGTSALVPEAADALAALVRDAPGSHSEIESALKDLTIAVGTALSLRRAPLPGGERLDVIERRAQAAESDAQSAAAEIHRLLDGARRLVGQYVDDRLATHYRAKADEEKSNADAWRRRTIIGFTGSRLSHSVAERLTV
ncbi:MAG: hypothetical protein ACRD2W_02600 [Acidimicrobiales bacterium]